MKILKWSFLFLLLIHLKVFSSSKPIYIIGDSHSLEFVGIPHCNIRHLGPITMNRIGRDGLNVLNLKNMGIPDNSIVVFSFGEIDVRCHIGKQRDRENREQDEIIETLVKKYIETILNNTKAYNNLFPVLYSVTPPTDNAFNANFPTYGPLQDRVCIAKHINQKLKDYSIAYQIPFIDVYEQYADKNGILREELSDGNVHINRKHNIHLRKALEEIILNYSN